MDIAGQNIDLLFKGFNTPFSCFHQETGTHWRKVAMDAASMGAEEVHGWLSAMPQMREWLGERFVRRVMASDHAIKNRKFESTITVRREAIEDDRLGARTPRRG